MKNFKTNLLKTQNSIIKLSEYVLSLTPSERYIIYSIITGTFYIGPIILGYFIGLDAGKNFAAPLLDNSLMTSTDPSILFSFITRFSFAIVIIAGATTFGIGTVYVLVTKGIAIGYAIGYTISGNGGTITTATIAPHSIFTIVAFFVSGVTSCFVLHMFIVFYRPPENTNRFEFKPLKEIFYLISSIAVLLLLGSIVEYLFIPELLRFA